MFCCEVRSESLNISHVVVSPKPGHAIAPAVSRRTLTEGARIRSLVSPCEICGGRSGNGTDFSPCLTERSNEVIPRLGRYSNLALPEMEAGITSFKILSRYWQIWYRITRISGCRRQNIVTIFIAVRNGLNCNLLGVNYWHQSVATCPTALQQKIYPDLRALIWDWQRCTSAHLEKCPRFK